MRNTLQGGWVGDAVPGQAPPNTYSLALNAVRNTDDHRAFGLATERSTLERAELAGQAKGTTYIERIHSTLIFQYGKLGSELHLFDHVTNTVTFLAADTEFGCNWNFSECEYMYAEVKAHNTCNDLLVYFAAGCEFFVVNITEMQDPVRKQAVKECRECDYFQNFANVCRPFLLLQPVPNITATTEGGAVSFVVRFEDADGNQSNWLSASATRYMGTRNNAPGEAATNAMRLYIVGTNSGYSYATIGVVKTVAGTVTAEVMDTLSIPSSNLASYLYYGQKGRPVDIATFSTKTKAYLRGQDLIQHDGMMFFYNIKNERNLDYQKYANNIQMSWVQYAVNPTGQRQMNFPSFMRGETYAFGIVLNYNDGTNSIAFPIGCNGSGAAGGKSLSGSDPHYRPFGPANFDTTDMHKRGRDPDPDEDENAAALEEALLANIANYDLTTLEMIAAGGCLDSQGQPVCCDEAGQPVEQMDTCSSAEDALRVDLVDVLKPIRDTFEMLGQMGQDVDAADVTTDNTVTLKDAVTYLLDKAVKRREYITRKRPVFNFTEGVGGGGTSQNKSKNTEDRSDSYTTPAYTTQPLEEVASGPLGIIASSLLYPDVKNCEGKRMFPTGNICHHRFPTVGEIPHFVSRVNGVQNPHQPHIDPYGDATIYLLGIRAENVHIPTADELPKPLCPHNPYSIVYVERNESNSTVLAAGYTTGMFQGSVFGTTTAHPRHGVNSHEHVDRTISAGDGSSRMGQLSTGSTHGYNFHSPDTDLAQPYLSATRWRNGLLMKGAGWRYGLYAKGTPPEDAYNGKRVDQRGARVANNLNHYDPSSGEIPIVALTYAPANTTVSDDLGGASLVNIYRESSVWMKTLGVVPGNEPDGSFSGDVLVHEAPTSCNANYGYLVRPIPDQYGPILNRMYIRTGVEGFGTSTSVSGVAGDVFIGPFSKRRTSYVSDKVGNSWQIPSKTQASRVTRSICDSGEDTLFELLGFTANHTALPESGDVYDPKNYAGLQTQGDVSLAPSEVIIGGGSRQDYYWPGTLKSLVHIYTESRVNTWKRQRGDESNGEIVYPGLRSVELDSASPDASPWENAWLNRFYKAIEQPSKAQEAKVVLIKSILMAIIPAGYLMRIADMTSLMEVVGELFVASGLNAIWAVAVYTLFTNDRLRNLFGIQQCRTDDEGGDSSEAKQLEDQYARYNWDYSTVTNYERILSMSSLYNTCACDDCDSGDEWGQGAQTNNEIYYTNKQNLDSEIDAYRTVKINQYNELPAHAGTLQRLFVQNDNLYAHTTEGIWTIQLGVGNLPADIGSQLTGAGQLLARPMLLLNTGMSEGFAGTNHPNSAINVPAWGYFFIDNKARKIYRFNGRPEDISVYGLQRFWRQHLPFCEDGDCPHDETGDRRFVLGWDPVQDTLLVTKKDGDKSFTASYSPMGEPGQWISLHSYTPDLYFRDRSRTFAINEGKIHEHHVGDGYLNFYGQDYEHFIQGSFIDPQSLKYFNLEKVTLLTEATEGGIDSAPKTFTEIAIWSANGSTGVRPLVIIPDTQDANSQRESVEETPDVIEVYQRWDEWDITKIHNVLDRTCNEGVITTKDPCDVVPTILNNVNCKLVLRQDFENRFIGGRYVNFRLIFRGGSTLLKTYAIDWNADGKPD